MIAHLRFRIPSATSLSGDGLLRIACSILSWRVDVASQTVYKEESTVLSHASEISPVVREQHAVMGQLDHL